MIYGSWFKGHKKGWRESSAEALCVIAFDISQTILSQNTRVTFLRARILMFERSGTNLHDSKNEKRLFYVDNTMGIDAPFFLYLFNTVPLHSLKYNSQRSDRHRVQPRHQTRLGCSRVQLTKPTTLECAGAVQISPVQKESCDFRHPQNEAIKHRLSRCY